VRYAYAITSALLLGGAAVALSVDHPAGAQTAQNEPGTISAAAPKAGAPMSFADMVTRLSPAVVNISTEQHVQTQNPLAGTPLEQFGFQAQPTRQRATSLGSGFLISPDGYIVTNNHVVAPGARGATVDSITVTLTDQREFKAKLIGRDPASDLAVLKIDGAPSLPFVRWGDSTHARVGDWIIAIGQPYGLGGTVTAGIISAVHRVTGQGGAYDRFIQTDAAINQGNSGGPMFDLSGNVIGVNSQILSMTGGNVGIGLAIPAEAAKPIVDTLMKGGKVARGYLGVGPQELTTDLATALGVPKDRGEIIARIEPGSPAEKAGIKQGDVIVKVAGKDVTRDTTLTYLVANQTPGSKVPFELIRDGKRVALDVTLGTRPPEDQIAGFNQEDDDNPLGNGRGGDGGDTQPASALGLDLVPLTPQIARQIGVDPTVKGVVVAQADPSSDAAEKGLRRGDVITSVDRAPVTTVEQVSRIVTQAKTAGRKQVLLYVQRRGSGVFIVVDLAQG
jgi:serine protease Do